MSSIYPKLTGYNNCEMQDTVEAPKKGTTYADLAEKWGPHSLTAEKMGSLTNWNDDETKYLIIFPLVMLVSIISMAIIVGIAKHFGISFGQGAITIAIVESLVLGVGICIVINRFLSEALKRTKKVPLSEEQIAKLRAKEEVAIVQSRIQAQAEQEQIDVMRAANIIREGFGLHAQDSEKLDDRALEVGQKLSLLDERERLIKA